MRRWEVIIQLIKQTEAKVVAEIGVCKGQTAIPVMKACALDRYWMIDPELNETVQEYALSHSPPSTYLVMTSEQAAEIVPDASLDLCFIDTIHTYEYVKKHTRHWQPKMKPGGILCYHDYENKRFPGVQLAVSEMFGGNVATIAVKACKVAVVQL